MEITSYIERTLLEVFENYTLRGHILCEEGLTSAHHMARCGAMAQAAGYDEEVVLAAFFHAIDRLLDPDECEEAGAFEETGGEYDEVTAEHLGASYLRNHGFSERIAGLVEGQVAARRYMAYRDALCSPARATAGGGSIKPMTPAEVTEFEERLDFLICLKLREWAEAARRPTLNPVSPMRYKEIARRHLLLQFGDFTLARR